MFESRAEADRFWQDVEKIAPGARAVNGDAERSIPCATGWGTFLDQPLRAGSPLTRRMEAEQAISNRDPQAFANLVKEFRLSQNSVQNSIGKSVPSIASQAVPQSVAGDRPPTIDPAKRKIPQSEIEKFYKESGSNKMKIEDADKLTKEYKDAYREGRVLQGV
jgi:hypothetical protein